MVKKAKGHIAVPLAVILALFMIPLSAHSASAKDAVDTTSEVIDPNHSRSLTITKLAASAKDGEPADGSVVDHQGFPIKGVTFTIERVPGIDLTTNDGWETASDMTTDNARVAIDEADPASRFSRDGFTNEKGELKFDDTQPKGLPLGLYLVTETGNDLSSSNVTLIDGMMKFLVTLPMPDPDDDGKWLYDVNVYPKNTAKLIVKEVRDAEAYRDGVINYDVRVEVPKSATKVVLTDVFDPKLAVDWTTLVTGAGSGHLSHPSWDDSSSPIPSDARDPLAAFGTAKLDDTMPLEGTKLTVTFSKDEIAARFTDQPGETMVFRFSVDAKATAAGRIDNDAHYVVTSPNGEYEGDSSPVYTNWGELIVTKKSTDGALLSGAVFEVYAGDDVDRDGVVKPNATPLATDTTDSLGVATFLLRYSDWADGAGTEGELSNGDVTYWVVEKTPPAGYELDSDNKPRKFRITDDNRSNGVVEMTYVNAQLSGPDLPTIGGNRAILPILGGLVVVGGVVWLVRSRRAND